jgi:hypothetical protein
MKMVELLHDSQPALCAVLEHGTPTVVSAEKVVVLFPDGSFFGKQAAAAPAKNALADIAERVLGQRPKIEIAEGKVANAPTVAAEQAKRREADRQQMEQTARNHPAVREAMSVFDATDADVRVEDNTQ